MKNKILPFFIFSIISTYSILSYADDSVVWNATGKDNNIQVGNGANIAGDEYWDLNSNENNEQEIDFSRKAIYADNLEKIKDNLKTELNEIEINKLKTSALAYGAQTGFYVRGKDINKALQLKTKEYDKVFNFAILQLEEGALPPVISEGQDAYNQPNDSEVRAADKIYKIEKPARLVNVIPHWQEYLYVTYSVPELPSDVSLPKTSEEKTLWDKFVEIGWSKGVEQADNVFKSNVGRLNQDFNGMIRYKILYERGLVEKPTIARTEIGVTGGGDEMAIGDRLIQITNKAAFNPDEARWLKNEK